MKEPYQDQLRVFAVLWAVAILFQLASVLFFATQITFFPPSTIGLIELALLVACIGLLWYPTRKWLLLVALIQLLDFAISLPHMPNHRLITAGMNFGLLLAFFRHALLKKKAKLPPFAVFATSARACVFIVYAFAFFHKLNPDFFLTETSCATVFYGHVRATFPLMPQAEWWIRLLPYLTLCVEGGIPLLLLFQKTRNFGLIFLLIFHSVLALDVEKHFFDFSSTMFALASLFLPLTFLSELQDAIPTRPYLKWERWRFIFTLVYLLATAGSLFHDTHAGYLIFFAGRQLLWWTCNAIFGLLLFIGLKQRAAEPLALFPRTVLVVLPLLFLLNGITPYLGIKTRSAFDMYSNLRVEGRRSNHFLIREPLDIFGNMNRLIWIEQVPDVYLQREIVNPGYLITEFELRRYLSRNPLIPITYVEDGARRVLAHAADEPALVRRDSLIKEKLLWYRPVDPQAHSRCQW